MPREPINLPGRFLRHTPTTRGNCQTTFNQPRDVPEINFHYFNEGNDTSGEDLQSVVEGVKFVRRMTEQSDLFVKTEMLPGVAIDEEEELKQFIKNEAWGITPVEPVKSDDWMTKWRF